MEKKQVPIVVAVIKDENGKLLVARRNDPGLPAAHNKWELIGGKIEFGETPEEAIIREVKEESGLEVTVSHILPKVFSRIWEKSDGLHQVFLLPYECSIVGGQLHTDTFDHKIAELRFITQEEIDTLDWIGPREQEMLRLSST